ncbi:MAG: M24 family metallopeptidase, partial [Nocardia sp.]|nr:M24 family metallopeptidase [Nocardia sp.]
MNAPNITEPERVSALLEAESKALELFEAVVERGLITAGASESEVSDGVRDLAARMFGIDRFWHKRVVRAGINTLQPYAANPPERILGADDICFLDFGPVFAEWEADFGRTYVLGGDPAKLALRDALEPMWHRTR